MEFRKQTGSPTDSLLRGMPLMKMQRINCENITKKREIHIVFSGQREIFHRVSPNASGHIGNLAGTRQVKRQDTHGEIRGGERRSGEWLAIIDQLIPALERELSFFRNPSTRLISFDIAVNNFVARAEGISSSLPDGKTRIASEADRTEDYRESEREKKKRKRKAEKENETRSLYFSGACTIGHQFNHNVTFQTC